MLVSVYFPRPLLSVSFVAAFIVIAFVIVVVFASIVVFTVEVDVDVVRAGMPAERNKLWSHMKLT